MNSQPDNSSQWQRCLHRPSFLIPTLGAAIAVGACVAVGSPAIAILIIGLIASVLLGVTCSEPDRAPAADAEIGLLVAPFRLARDGEMFDAYQRLMPSLLAISQRSDPIYRQLAAQRLQSMNEELASIANQTFVFAGTETWRIVYEQLLRSPGIHRYRSVAWAKNRHYWLDEPGRKSMQLNYELRQSGQVQIERIIILADELWPPDQPMPVEPLRDWIREHNYYELATKLVRQSSLAQEPDLMADIGIYGSRALGVQELDDHCHTIRFMLTFDFDQVSAAEERWNRLSVYAIDYANLFREYLVSDADRFLVPSVP